MSGDNLTFTVAMVTKMAAKIGYKQESDHFGANLRHVTEKSHVYMVYSYDNISSIVDFLRKHEY